MRIFVLCLLFLGCSEVRLPPHLKREMLDHNQSTLDQIRALKAEYEHMKSLLDDQDAVIISDFIYPLPPSPRAPRLNLHRQIWHKGPHMFEHQAPQLIRGAWSPFLIDLTDDLIMNEEDRLCSK